MNHDAPRWFGDAEQFLQPPPTPVEIFVTAPLVIIAPVFFGQIERRVGKGQVSHFRRQLA
jgi:hypothetical protein